MKNNNCKVVQDLLPNYVEKLTSKETNNFVEEHLKECENCQKVLDIMKSDLKNERDISEKKEVDYMKTFKNKLNILKLIIIVIVVIFLVVVGRKMFILSSLTNKANSLKNENNYYAELSSYSNGSVAVTKSFTKDGNYLFTYTKFQKDSNVVKLIDYKKDNDELHLVENGESKFIAKNNPSLNVRPIFLDFDNFFNTLVFSVSSHIDSITLDGLDCYVLKDDNVEKFIDKDTGLIIKMIDYNNNVTTDYHYEFNVVKDEDIVKPDTTGYELSE